MSYLVDTKVLSELRNRKADAKGVAWMQARPRQSLYRTLVTRNTKDFEGLGVQGVNPWDA